MVSPLEVFDQTVEEALFNIMETPDGDDAIIVMLDALSDVVEDFTQSYINTHIVDLFPRAVEIDGEKTLNPIFHDRASFSPLFAVLAEEFYRQAQSGKPYRFRGEIIPNDEALFGAELTGFMLVPEKKGRSGELDTQSWSREELALFAGSVAAAVRLVFEVPYLAVAGFMVLQQRISGEEHPVQTEESTGTVMDEITARSD